MDLEQLRLEIDQVDARLVELFSRRMEIAAAIAAYKKEHALPVLDTSREEEKIKAVTSLAPPAVAEYIAPLYAELFALSRSYQNKLLEGGEVI